MPISHVPLGRSPIERLCPSLAPFQVPLPGLPAAEPITPRRTGRERTEAEAQSAWRLSDSWELWDDSFGTSEIEWMGSRQDLLDLGGENLDDPVLFLEDVVEESEEPGEGSAGDSEEGRDREPPRSPILTFTARPPTRRTEPPRTEVRQVSQGSISPASTWNFRLDSLDSRVGSPDVSVSGRRARADSGPSSQSLLLPLPPRSSPVLGRRSMVLDVPLALLALEFVGGDVTHLQPSFGAGLFEDRAPVQAMREFLGLFSFNVRLVVLDWLFLLSQGREADLKGMVVRGLMADGSRVELIPSTDVVEL